MLTAFFATLFATLLVLRPDFGDPSEPMPVDSRPTQSTPRVNTPSISAPPVSAPPISAPPISAPPPDSVLRAEPKPEPKSKPTLQSQLEQLGVKCAEGVDCYPD